MTTTLEFLFVLTMRTHEQQQDAKPASKLDYSAVGSTTFFRNLKRSSGWEVDTKMECDAAFFVVNKNGDRFLSTAGTDGGGRVRKNRLCF